MKHTLRALAIAACLLPGIAAGQVPQFPQTLPPNTVIGHIGTTPGPSQAIPFSVLSSQLTGAVITLNSGNGQTAPGAMAGGNTYSFGSTGDKVQMTGLGLGGAAPLTGLEIYNAAVSPTGNGQGVFGGSSTNGGVLGGQGSTYDAVIQNKNGAIALGVTTGTQNLVAGGNITAASLLTSGTIAGAVCLDASGHFINANAANCFAVSGISVTSGKTLTITNTLTFSGTDGTVFTFPGTSDTIDTLAANQTISGNKTFSGTLNITGTGQINGTAFGTFATANSATPPAIGGTTPNTGAFSTLSSTTPMGITSGGTNASTAAGARASGGLNIDGLTAHGDSNYQILAADRVVGTSTTLTAARTWTLPAASSVNAGQRLYVQDLKGFVSNTNTITIPRNGSDTINGGTGSQTINNANGGFLFISDGVSNWSAQALGAQATAGVASINGQTGNPSIVAGAGIGVSTTGGNISVSNVGVTSLNTATGAITLLTEPQGRLTLTANTPVMSASATAQTTVRYDCYIGNQVPYYTGTADAIDTVSSCEVTDAMVSAASAGQVVSGQVYDMWWVHGGANRICLAMSASTGGGGGWASDTGGSATTRGTGYSQLDRITRPYATNKNSITNCFNAATNYGPVSANQGTYLATCVASGNGQFSWTLGSSGSGGVAAFLGCWNAYNRVNVSTTVMDTGTHYTYTSATPQQARASAGNQVTFVTGAAEDAFFSNVNGEINTALVANAFASYGIGLDSITTFSSPRMIVLQSFSTGLVIGSSVPSYSATVLGKHIVSMNQSSDGSNANTFDESFTDTLIFQLRM